MRKLISDFSIFLSILSFVGLDMLMGLDTPKLIVPTEFKVFDILLKCMVHGLTTQGFLLCMIVTICAGSGGGLFQWCSTLKSKNY